MNLQLYPLSVAETKRETDDALSITFTIPSELNEAFAFTAGQYITLEIEINGEKVRRAYSMCSAPHEQKLTVAVKRTKGGVMSNFLNDHIKQGSVVNVMPPQGRFTTPLSPSNTRTFYLLGGGSGITPLFSILKTVLHEEPKTVVHLLYGNENEDSIIFKNELDALEKHYEGQLFVQHILAKPKEEKSGGMFSFIKKPIISWKGLTGVPDKKNIENWLSKSPQHTKEAIYFTCGPLPMMQNLEQIIVGKGIDKHCFHKEVFASPTDSDAKPAVSNGGAMMSATLGGKKLSLEIAASQTVLDAMLKAGYDAPYSCKSGACSTCIAKISKGKVSMDACFALDDDEIKNGYILACQAKPTTSELELNFDV